MSTLQENLDAIKLDKDTNLLPENLKKNVTCLGVTGTYEGSGGGTVEGIKQFATIEEMQDDTTAKEGDLAVVYRSEIQSIKDGDVITSMTFPKTVVFDTAITSSYNARLFSNSVDCDIGLNSTQFYLYDMNGTIPEITYTSSDGITYTRTDSNEDTYEIGETTVRNVDEHICKFIQVGGSTFEGLFENQIVDDTSKPYLPFIVPDGSRTFTKSSKPFDMTGIDFYKDGSYRVMVINTYTETDTYLVPKDFTIYTANCNISMGFNSTLNFAFVYASTSNSFATTYEITKQTYTNNVLADTTLMTPSQNTPSTCFSSSTSNRYLEIITNKYVWCLGNGTEFQNCDNVKSFPLGNDYHGGSSFDVPYNLSKINKYIPAKNQFTAVAESVYNGSFYGKNGIEDGILQQTSSLSFNQLKQHIKIFNDFESLASDIVSMNDMFTGDTSLTHVPKLKTPKCTTFLSTFRNCSNLVCVDEIDTSGAGMIGYTFAGCSKLTSVPPINSSNATCIYYLFDGCTLLKDIPLLDTSKVTDMRGTFSGCSSFTDEDLNKVLLMCANSSVTNTSWKTLSNVGLTSEQANKCKTLSNYSAFTAAGWTTGY